MSVNNLYHQTSNTLGYHMQFTERRQLHCIKDILVLVPCNKKIFVCSKLCSHAKKVTLKGYYHQQNYHQQKPKPIFSILQLASFKMMLTYLLSTSLVLIKISKNGPMDPFNSRKSLVKSRNQDIFEKFKLHWDLLRIPF